MKYCWGNIRRKNLLIAKPYCKYCPKSDFWHGETKQVKSALTLTNCVLFSGMISCNKSVISTHPKAFRTKWWRLWCHRFCGKLQQIFVELIFYYNCRRGHGRCKHLTAYVVHTLGGRYLELSQGFHQTPFTWRYQRRYYCDSYQECYPRNQFKFEKLSGTTSWWLFNDEGRKDDCGKANESHSFTDSLNLAFGDAIMTTKVMKNSLEITLEITKLIKKSQKRNGKLKDNKNAIHQQEVSEVF